VDLNSYEKKKKYLLGQVTGILKLDIKGGKSLNPRVVINLWTSMHENKSDIRFVIAYISVFRF